jgi:hypothetical protein
MKDFSIPQGTMSSVSRCIASGSFPLNQKPRGLFALRSAMVGGFCRKAKGKKDGQGK